MLNGFWRSFGAARLVSLFGAMRGSIVIQGDILSPIDVDWEADR